MENDNILENRYEAFHLDFTYFIAYFVSFFILIGCSLGIISTLCCQKVWEFFKNKESTEYIPDDQLALVTESTEMDNNQVPLQGVEHTTESAEFI